MSHEPQIELIVRLTDNSFESKIIMPLDITDEARNGFVRSWLGLMDAGLKVTTERRGAAASNLNPPTNAA